MSNGHLLPGAKTEHYDENTLFKVYDALRNAGLTEKIARGCISSMQNQGILFRERIVNKPTGPVYRGVQAEAVSVAVSKEPPSSSLLLPIQNPQQLVNEPMRDNAQAAADYEEIMTLTGRGYLMAKSDFNSLYRSWEVLDLVALPARFVDQFKEFGEVRWYNPEPAVRETD